MKPRERSGAPPRGRLYRLAYPARGQNDRHTRLHQLRDADALLWLVAPIFGLGYWPYSGPLLNWPGRPEPEFSPKPGDGDLVALLTRPPLDDDPEHDIKAIARSESALEREIFSVVRRYLKWCTRSEIVLTETCAALLPAGFHDRRDIVFHQHRNASYKRLGNRKLTERDQLRTAAFLIREEGFNADGSDLLLAFGMGGPETLVWSRILGTLREDLLLSSRFVMADLHCPWYGDEGDAQVMQPDDLGFVDQVEVEVLIREDLAPAAPKTFAPTLAADSRRAPVLSAQSPSGALAEPRGNARRIAEPVR